MQWRQANLACVVALAAVLALAPFFAHAEPKAPSQEQNADAAFAASFIGKTYDGDLDVEGWDDVGGGLVAAPIYIHEYQREDGTFLVLTSRIGEAKGPENKEWWTEVRRAGEIALDTGKISSTKTKGVRCTNVSWGPVGERA
jgi:hypothetical protein